MKLKLGVLLSGRGSNLLALADAIEAGKLDAEIAVVISNKAYAPGVEAAQQRGLHAHVIQAKGLAREQHDAEIIRTLQQHGVELVVLAGYMRLLSAQFIHAYRDRIVNIHPSLLPAFPGLHAQQQALDYGVKVAGCTVHFVGEGLDDGPIILQKAVQVRDDDTEETLSARILEQEHVAYAEALQLMAEGRVRIEGRRVRLAAQ
ncbi:MAG: phosphoribosylglycinamide formyltransferase [Acidobacteriaceae bacterium]